MTHWKSMQDEKPFIQAHDLGGRDVVVTIESIAQGEIVGEQGKKARRPIASLVGAKKKFVMNPTNCKTLELLTGSPEIEDWIGATITLYPSTTTMNGGPVPCIRVRPKLPAKKEQP